MRSNNYRLFWEATSLADILATTSNPLPDQEFVTYLLTGLGFAYESFITSVTIRAEPIASHELYQLLLVHESHISHNARSTTSSIEPTVHFTTASGRDQRGRIFTRGGRNGCSGRGRSNYFARASRHSSIAAPTNSQHFNNHRPTGQVCYKSGHVALQCRHRFDHSYQYEAPHSFSTNFTSPSAFSNATWYPDTAATHHITHDLTNLNLSSEPYGGEQIRVGDGSGLPIQNIGDSSLSSTSPSFL
ncbi:hypothetical protein F2P56_018556 [Juglans regia]|uniref:Uncharacterized protein n=1 Tax=Juglans regia TaxID=51240 RepID=A0A833X6T9_JUGRE|nr:hypothetical protein F2P56_018556 [Juglans regia]